MIYNVEHADWICSEMKEMRRDNHVKLNRDDVRDWLYTINRLNALRPGVKVLNDEEISNFKVPTKLSAMIVPSKVTVSQGNYERDFMKTIYRQAHDIAQFVTLKDGVRLAEEYNPNVLDAEDFNKVSRKMLRSFKLDDAKLSSVEELHIETLLSTEDSRAILNGYVIKKQTSFIPLELSFFKFEDDEYSYPEDKMFKLYIEENLFYSSDAKKDNQ